eukprot:10057740-Ditylum_brightwellii.AAC.1
MTNEETDNTYKKIHVIFQLTSSCNVQAVNMLSCVSLFKDTTKRRMGGNKHKWIIEMNEG